jgi:hypothetical protein
MNCEEVNKNPITNDKDDANIILKKHDSPKLIFVEENKELDENNPKLNKTNLVLLDYENQDSKNKITINPPQPNKDKILRKESFMDFLVQVKPIDNESKFREAEINFDNYLETQRALLAKGLKFEGNKDNEGEGWINCQKCLKKFSNFLRKIILSGPFSFFATFAIIIILFIEDIRTVAIDKKHDNIIDIVLVMMITFIGIEISLFITIIRSYRFSFFFWLDIASVLSLIPDIMILFVHDENLDYASTNDQRYVTFNLVLCIV